MPSISRPIKLGVVDAVGREAEVCAKMLRSGTSDASTLAAELVGSVIGQELELPIPQVGLVWVPGGLLQAAASAALGLQEGWAVGSLWLDGVFDFVGLAGRPPRRIINPTAIAGATVLDTLINNGDRHSSNILVEHAGSGAKLWLIDQAMGLGGTLGSLGPALFTEGMPPGSVACRAPRDEDVCELVATEEAFNPYILSAEGLAMNEIEAFAAGFPALGWGLDSRYSEVIGEHMNVAKREIRRSIYNGLDQFPNCRVQRQGQP